MSDNYWSYEECRWVSYEVSDDLGDVAVPAAREPADVDEPTGEPA